MIGQQSCLHSLMKHKKDLSDMIGCLKVVRIYSFVKEIKVYLLVQFYPWFELYFPLFLVMVIYNNEFETGK